ncbi:nitrogenase cofactor biosynthesis protein NifB [Pectinatus frisingensis]|uniref:nitrogenase cofactor biosynthesis protein NifB n=1 Tax=Pectinatus frisingensis TaxID=865 RepID=UPI0015F5A6F3|nr:nitrogenase cofactor biosynthesis protein NifB [Pectinatus frisingensis]
MENAVNLNVNPCKMCVPLGSVTALYGIARCMSILHGSQGCSTYIRRHMATHYNEPVDIASSSLTEEGTVFGGEKNLLSGLENLIRLYSPEVIGVSTTCLAETIGEDVPGIIKKFYELHPECTAEIIPVSSPSYAGTHFDGFFRATRAVVENVSMDIRKNNKVNIVTGMISPVDTRYLKHLLNMMQIDYILLPDISDNLDGVHLEKYDRLPKGGTSLSDIKKMAGAKYTIELSTFNNDDFSPAVYLQQQYGVPYCRLDLPIGIKATDALINKLKELGGMIPEELQKERGRCLDAMIDSHKYNAMGKAAIFGEPDIVAGVVNICCENGVIPVVCATGSVCHAFDKKLREKVEKTAKVQFVEKIRIKDDADFTEIENCVIECEANIMIGSGDGYRIEERTDIPLLRCTFPIHDRVGGQRVRLLGYDGAMQMLDNIANTLLAKLEGSYRQNLYDKYFRPENESATVKLSADNIVDINQRQVLKEKTLRHPCYTCGSGQYARIHLPIAPKCNIQCNYCIRKYDCPNESRPGVTTEILSPQEAFEKYMLVKKRLPNLTVAGIAGPGDALANFEQTRQTLYLIRQADPTVTFCLSTNGLMLPQYAQEIIDLGVTHVTVTLNAVDPEIGAKIYKHIDYMGQRYTGISGAGILLGNQLNGIRYLTRHGVICKINIVMLKGINEEHIVAVVKKAKELGCEITNIMQLIPVKGSAFENMPLVSNKEIMDMRKKCGLYMKQMYHCRQCRADAIGTLENDLSIEYRNISAAKEKPARNSPYRFAAASKSGMIIDCHFGQTEEFYIYESDGIDLRFIEKRNVEKYCLGKENCGNKTDKIEKIIITIKDCTAVIALRIGEVPRQRLKDVGIEVITTYDRIENAVKKAAESKNAANEVWNTAL